VGGFVEGKKGPRTVRGKTGKRRCKTGCGRRDFYQAKDPAGLDGWMKVDELGCNLNWERGRPRPGTNDRQGTDCHDWTGLPGQHWQARITGQGDNAPPTQLGVSKHWLRLQCAAPDETCHEPHLPEMVKNGDEKVFLYRPTLADGTNVTLSEKSQKSGVELLLVLALLFGGPALTRPTQPSHQKTCPKEPGKTVPCRDI